MNSSDQRNENTAIVAAPSWQFVQQLLGELDDGRVALPGWSRNAEAMCAAVSDESLDEAALVALLSANAELSMRLLNMANAPSFARGARALAELAPALRRLGRDNLRTAIYSWALAQLRFAPRLVAVREQLHTLWRESTAVAATARLLAAQVTDLDANAALLAGLLHNLGKYYFIARMDPHDPLLADAQLREQLLSDWHPAIGGRLAELWRLPPVVGEVINGIDTVGLEQSHAGGMVGVVAAAIVAAGAPEPLAETATHLATFTALRLGARDWQALLPRARAEAEVLRSLLGD